ncbi:MAG: zf-HC2 domain-containing protein [Clostridia bacterium]|nr:zf-HC2 domain-containing protein [Clostridia bacterium]
MKGECNVARDLMPLCIDGAASKESEAYVDGHVAECGPCRAYYEDMKNRLPERLATQAEAEDDAFARTAAKLRRRRKLRRVILCALAVALVAALVAVGAVAYRMDFKMPASWYEVTLARLENGDVITTLRTNRKIRAEGMAGYLSSVMTANADGTFSPAEAWNIYWGGYRFGHRSDKYSLIAMRIRSDIAETLESIVYGDAADTVVWRRGEEIPKASPEMEAFFAAADERNREQREMVEERLAEQNHHVTLQNNDEETARQKAIMRAIYEEAQKTVPEWGAGENDVEIIGVLA